MPGLNVGGYSFLWFIRLRPKYINDQGILEHEKKHVEQFWRLPIISGWLYRLSKKYRLWAEVQAYREQLKYLPAIGSIEKYRQMFAIFISTRYKLKISNSEVYRRLAR